jgi:hypothetical protein
MKFALIRSLRKFLLSAALALAVVVVPMPHRVAAAHTTLDVVVDVHVTVHNSDIGVSQETLDNLVEHLLTEAHIKCEKEKADAVAVQLKIDIYREDNGHFKIDGDLSGPPDEVENGEDKEEKDAATQDQIDDMVEAIVHDFIKFIHHA